MTDTDYFDNIHQMWRPTPKFFFAIRKCNWIKCNEGTYYLYIFKTTMKYILGHYCKAMNVRIYIIFSKKWLAEHRTSAFLTYYIYIYNSQTTSNFIINATDAIYDIMCVFLSHPKRLPRMEIRRKYSPSLRLSVHPICVRHKLGLHKLGSDKKYGSDHQRSIMNTLDCNRILNINQIAKNKG